jgi:hypothetical protein
VIFAYDDLNNAFISPHLCFREHERVRLHDPWSLLLLSMCHSVIPNVMTG